MRRAGLLLLILAAACETRPAGQVCGNAAALKVCAGPDVVHGIDVSTYQGVVDWAKVRAAGIEFAFARVSDGTTYPDAQFARNWPAMKAAGVVRGVYQYFRPGQDATAQGQLVLDKLAQVGALEPGDLPVVMDIETADGQTAPTVQQRMTEWLTFIERATGRKPIIYAGASMSSTIGNGFSAYDLWVANWGVTCPTLPSNWTSWRFWQYSSTGTVNGITGAVDLDEWTGTRAALNAYTLQPPPDAGAPPDATSRDAGPFDDAGPDEAAPDDLLSAEPPDAGAADLAPAHCR
jgi:lysozyme